MISGCRPENLGSIPSGGLMWVVGFWIIATWYSESCPTEADLGGSNPPRDPYRLRSQFPDHFYPHLMPLSSNG